MGDFYQKLQDTVLNSANVKDVNTELLAHLQSLPGGEVGAQASVRALELFAEKNRQTIERLEKREEHLLKTLTEEQDKYKELQEEHKLMKMDYATLADDLKQSRAVIDKMKLERDEGQQVKLIKEKVKKQFEVIKAFNFKRTEATKEMSDLVDQTFKLLKMDVIQLDPEACEADYDKELFDKLHEKIVLLNETIFRKSSD